MARYKLEGEKPTSFFCRMNEKMKNSARFDTLIIKEKDESGVEKENTITEKKSI